MSNPEIVRGTPVFRRTRIPVNLVADMLVQGATADEIFEGYPTLSKERSRSRRCKCVHSHGGTPSRRFVTERMLRFCQGKSAKELGTASSIDELSAPFAFSQWVVGAIMFAIGVVILGGTRSPLCICLK